MKSFYFAFLFVCGLMTACAPLVTTQPVRADVATTCPHDRAALLALGQHAFDQDMNGGWRLIARDGRCTGVTADLIRDYRTIHNITSSILFWHEGQLRANMGATIDAIPLLEQSRLAEDDRIGWNYYVAATVAFLRNDRLTLEQARSSLAAFPRPKNFPIRRQDGTLIDWPVNLKVVDGLVKCFGQSYADAYSTKCRG